MKQTLQLWKKIYSLSEEFFDLKPWEYMNEDDMFAVQSPETQMDYFISVLGELGEEIALVAYEGTDALNELLNLKKEVNRLSPENFLTISYMILSHDSKKYVDENQLKIRKQLNYKDQGSDPVPHLRKNIPAMYPSTPDKNSLVEFIYILQESINVIKRAKQNMALLNPQKAGENKYLFRVARDDGGKWSWNDEYRSVDQTGPETLDYYYDKQNGERFKKLPAMKDEVELEVKLLSTPVKDKNEPPYFPFILIFADSRSGTILGFEILKPLPGYKEMLKTIPSLFINMCINVGKQPHKIKYRDYVLEGICTFLDQKVKTLSRYSGSLPNLDPFVREFLNTFAKQSN